jgi:hypothetical protein
VKRKRALRGRNYAEGWPGGLIETMNRAAASLPRSSKRPVGTEKSTAVNNQQSADGSRCRVVAFWERYQGRNGGAFSRRGRTGLPSGGLAAGGERSSTTSSHSASSIFGVSCRISLGTITRIVCTADWRTTRRTAGTRLKTKLVDQVAFERVNRGIDQPGAIIAGDDFNSGGAARPKCPRVSSPRPRSRSVH